MTHGQPQRDPLPVLEHGDWVRVYIDPDESGEGPGFIRIEERRGAPGVAILPLLGTSIGLVSVFRRTTGQLELEIPRGFGGESGGVRADALRELREETGILLNREGDLIELGEVFPNTGILGSRVVLFAVHVNAAQIGRVEDTKEVSHFDWYELALVTDFIRRGRIRDGFTLSAILQATLHGLMLLPPATGGGR